MAMVGSAGLLPTLAAINAGKDIALANKETLVMAGEIVMRRASEKGVRILPVDSEHSAIFQSMAGNRRHDVEKIFLTASGGPFMDKDITEFHAISLDDALKHPNWEMGRKITIDSATMMNKGLEVIEAKYLFDIPEDHIEVVVHPQSIIHSMVGYTDGSVIAQLGVPDMKGAIAYALSWPERLPIRQPLPDFFNISTLTFRKPDPVKFPCLSLAQRACRTGKTLPAVLNAANEIAVYAFLDKKITFTDIPEIIRTVMEAHSVIPAPDLDDIISADQWARETAETFCGGRERGKRMTDNRQLLDL
jgi:1-deoxy-D-xylulose-5-phosphate reductoisomerase